MMIGALPAGQRCGSVSSWLALADLAAGWSVVGNGRGCHNYGRPFQDSGPGGPGSVVVPAHHESTELTEFTRNLQSLRSQFVREFFGVKCGFYRPKAPQGRKTQGISHPPWPSVQRPILGTAGRKRVCTTLRFSSDLERWKASTRRLYCDWPQQGRFTEINVLISNFPILRITATVVHASAKMQHKGK